jgi:DNA polymerase III alpha subunit
MLAKNATGYKNLSKLCSLGYIDGFYSKYPRIDKELIEKYHEGLIATTCCLGASVPQAIMRGGTATWPKRKRSSSGGWTSSARTTTWSCNATAFPSRTR